MEWSKIKNIIILILLLLNGFLLFLVEGREAQDARSRERARADAIAAIQNSGVSLPEGIVPQTVEPQPMQFSRDLEAEGELAKKLLGGEVTVEARGGEVYRYHNASGSIQFHSGGEFLAQFEPGTFPLDGQDVLTHAAAVLALLDFSGEAVETTFAGGEGSVTFRQSLDGMPLLGCQATLNYSDGQLVSITDGKRVNGTPYADSRGTVSVATALMRLFNGLNDLGDIYSRIDSITPAYTLSVSLSGPSQLTPVWQVRTDTGTYQLDTVSSVLTRVSRWELSVQTPELSKDFTAVANALT